MKQRVLIAAALLHDPDLLIFDDEAQSGLDIALLFRHILRELAARGKCVLYISHVLELVGKICEHVVVIYKGRIVADDSVIRLRDSDAITQFGGNLYAARAPGRYGIARPYDRVRNGLVGRRSEESANPSEH